MPRIIHRVFVSSTYEDLREERAEVQKALLMLDCFPVGMELFTADDDETWEFIKRQIAESDYYVVIVAGRYGSVAPDGISFTEKEYDYAREIGKPAIGFLHADIGSLPARNVESDPSLRNKLEAFKGKIRPHPVRFFKSSHQLATEVVASLVKLRDSHPTPGFVRANEAADISKYVDLLEENSRLRERIKATDELRPFPRSGDQVGLTASIMKPSEGPSEAQFESRTFSLARIFVTVVDSIIDGCIRTTELENAVMRELFAGTHILHVLDFDGILRTFFGLGLIDFDLVEEEEGGFFGRSSTASWSITELGQRQYGLLRVTIVTCDH